MLSSNPLTIARQKLQATDVPMLLRVSYYLRISCSKLNSDVRYSSLMQTLHTQHPGWLETCVVTPVGTLRSSHRQVDALLPPIAALHQAEPLTELCLPAAA